MASEKRMRTRAKELVGSDLQAEAAPFSFPLPEGGEAICSAPFAYILDLGRRIQMLLDENERYTLLTCTLLKIYICTNLQAGAVNLA